MESYKRHKPARLLTGTHWQLRDTASPLPAPSLASSWGLPLPAAVKPLRDPSLQGRPATGWATLRVTQGSAAASP